MSILLTIDWKFILALGGSAGIIIVTSKLDSDSAEKHLRGEAR